MHIPYICIYIGGKNILINSLNAESLQFDLLKQRAYFPIFDIFNCCKCKCQWNMKNRKRDGIYKIFELLLT